MKLLWLSHFIPYPPRGGERQRSFNLLRQISRHHDVHLVAFNRPEASSETLRGHERVLREFCAAVDFWELPYRWRGPRWWAQVAAGPLCRNPFVYYLYGTSTVRRRWQELLALNPGCLVHVDSTDLAGVIAGASGNVVVLNHHNCESAMLQRRASLEKNPLKRFLLADQGQKQSSLERELCAKVAMNLAVSALDAELLRRVSPGAQVRVVENGTDVNFFRPQGEPEPRSIIFTGSLDWYPNQSALTLFREKIWPILRQRSPDLRFYLAGQRPQDWMRHWANDDPQITIVDSPEDIRPWISRAAVFVCPIVDGGGTRLKLLDAMAMGKAIVSTTVGAEGIEIEHGREMLLADSPGDFAAQVCRLLDDPGLRRQISVAARQFVEQRYAWEHIGGHLQEAYLCAQERNVGEPAVAL